MNRDLKQLLDFVRFTHQFRLIERAIIFENHKRLENDMEHSYQTALVAWFIIDKHKLKLDKLKCAGMALMHDLIEIHAGDVPLYQYGAKAPKYKLDREAKAVQTLKKQWPSFKSMHALVKEYEAQKTAEAKFVYALDKVIPVMNNYVYEGRIWKREKLDFNWLKEVKEGKTDRDKTIHQYYLDLMSYLKKHPELFGKPKRLVRKNG